MSGFTIVLLLIGGLFALTTSWILLAPESLPPREWWERYVEPEVRLAAKAEADGNLAEALDHWNRAIAKGRERRSDFPVKFPPILVEGGRLEEKIRREKAAGRALEELERRVLEAEQAAEPWKLRHDLRTEAFGVKDLSRGTRWWNRYLETESRIRALPGPPPPWSEVRRDAARAMEQREFSKAARLAREFLERAGPKDRSSVEQFLDLLDRRALEDYRVHHRGGTDVAVLETELDRYRGTAVERRIREALATGKGN